MYRGRLPFANAIPSVLSTLPAADRKDLSELSISDVRAWSIAKADEHHRCALAFNTIQNILAPIHRLPPEILSKVFVEAWHDRRSLRLTHVCRLWRTLLLDTSEFWAVAIAGDKFHLPSENRDGVSDEDYLGAASLRSAPRAISIHFSSVSPKSHLWLTQHTHRITSIRISAHTRDQLETMWKVLHAGMPRLKDLAVRVHGGYVSDSVPKWAGPTQISTEALPLLTRLTIPAFLFLGVWPNALRGIAFRSDSIHSVVTLDTVLASLENYPSLTVLDIRDKTLFHATRSSPPSRSTFPMLELLRIRSEWSVASMILSLLTFPPSTCLQIRIVRGSWRASGELFVPGAALDAAVAHIDHVTIHSGPTSTIHGLSDGTARLRVTADWEDWSPRQLERTLRIFERTGAPILRLLLAQHTAQRIPETFKGHTVFAAFSRLTNLTLHGRSGVCAALLRVLSPPPPGFQEPVLLLPLLKDLTVGIATKRRSEISKSLRRGDLTRAHWPDRSVYVSIHFKECCKLFPGVLDTRSQRGCRLSRLEFFSFEEGCMAKADSVVSHVDLAALMPGLVEHAIWPLQGLVDGPVVFSGYWFFAPGA
ncbi:hypothetical protein V8D89_004393 [Ganoderma adspersum]